MNNEGNREENCIPIPSHDVCIPSGSVMAQSITIAGPLTAQGSPLGLTPLALNSSSMINNFTITFAAVNRARLASLSNKDKTFFDALFEGLRENKGNATVLGSRP